MSYVRGTGGGAGPYSVYDKTAAPTVNDDVDLGYAPGSRWVDVTADKAYVCLDNTDGAAVWTETTAGAAGGETNTCSNQGAGVGVYATKTGVDLELRSLVAASSKITIAADAPNKEVDFDVAEGQIVHQNLSGAGTNTHAQIDTHVAATANPHSTDIGNLGSGTLAELNTAVSDATLDDSSSTRDPTNHASNHTDGTDDIQNATSGQKGVATAAQITKLDGIEALADVTDAANVASAGAIMDSDISAGEGWMRKTGAGAYEAIKTNLSASVAPTVNDDSGSGYAVGSLWIDTTADKAYVCLDATGGAAVWTETTQSGGGATVVTAASVIGDNRIVRGDGGSRGVQGAAWLLTDAGAIQPATAGNPIYFRGDAHERILSSADSQLDMYSANAQLFKLHSSGVTLYKKMYPTDGTVDLGLNSAPFRYIFGSSCYLEEKAAAAADYAGLGQLWVKTATPCELWFTDDAGTDTKIV